MRDELKRARKGYEGYLRYAGLGLTMAGIVLGFTFAGWWLDQRLHWPFPALTVALSLLGIAGALLYLFRETARR
jgi:hypothetical protein